MSPAGHDAARRVLLFAAAWTALLGAARLFVLARHGQLPVAAYLPGLGLGLAGEFVQGLVAAWLLLGLCGGGRCRAAALALLAALIAVKLGAFHYEAVFNRLPDIRLLFYVRELAALSASLDANVPLPQLLAELALVTLALAVLARRTGGVGDAVRFTPGHGAGIAAALLVAVVVNVWPSAIPAVARSASREPLIGLVQTAVVRRGYDLDRLHLEERDFTRFLALHGDAAPGPVLDPRYPLCRLRALAPDAQRPGPSRSAIVLILESVGRREVFATFRGEPLMPNLARMSREYLGFGRARAPGIKSIQTLTALFSALPPNPFDYYLWRTPLPRFDGWPRQLAQRGWDTAYFHGGDLSFERQRPYLEAVGFRAVHELDVRSGAAVHGWGYDDATMFRALRDWVDARPAGTPYLATLFTLSTHDPYLVPPEWTPVFSPVARQLREPGRCCAVIGEPDTAVALAETYRFLDAQIGVFDAWYRSLSPRPLLLVLGDHAPYVVKDGAASGDGRLRFDIPVILGGLDADERARLAPYADAPLAVHDLPVLMSRLLGVPPHPCLMGPDLLAGARGPETAYAIGPESLQYMHLWRDDAEFVLDRAANEVIAYDASGAPLPAADTQWVRDFAAATFPVHYYLLEKDAYFPRPPAAVTALPAVTRPLFAAHRANVDGPQDAAAENSRAALARAAGSAVDAIEIDVQQTADAVPVLAHDAALPGDPNAVITDLTPAELRARPAGHGLVTLDEALAEFLPRKRLLVELKPPSRLQDRQQMAHAVAALVRRHGAGRRVIVDSFDEFLATSAKRQCDCESGLDLPYQRPVSDSDLAHVRELGLDWIYVETSVVTAELVRRAHAAGLKVMAYTVNDRAVLEGWRRDGALPDGVITDHADLAR